MPLALLALALVVVEEALHVELLRARRRDHADLVVAGGAVLARPVADRVDVQPRRRRLARQLAETLH